MEFEFEFVDDEELETSSRRKNEKVEINIDFSNFEFEFVDEDEIEFASRNKKPKKTESMFDIPLENRKYWGGDPSVIGFDDGYHLLFGLVEMRIIKTINKFIIIELDEDPNFRRLKKEDRDYFIKLQNELLHEKQREWEAGSK